MENKELLGCQRAPQYSIFSRLKDLIHKFKVSSIPKSEKKKYLPDELTDEIKKISESVQLLAMIQIKKNNLDYNKLLDEIYNKIPNANDEFSETLLKKMKKYSDDKSKLKELRKESGIKFDMFYTKLKTL